MSEHGGLASRYAAALHSYLGGGGEGALQSAYEVGRQALEAGLGPLVLFSIHRDAVDRFPLSQLEEAEFSTRVTTVFIETLAPFEMTYASLDSSRAAVRELRATVARERDELNAIHILVREADSASAHQRMAELMDRHGHELDQARERLESVARTSRARQSLIADIVSAQEEERRRLAGEIHDDAVQVMAAVSLRLSLLKRKLGGGEHVAVIEQLESAVGDSINGLRQLIAGLRPAELERAGLTAAIRSALQHANDELGLEYHIIDLCEHEPSTAARTTAFRIFREGLTNVRKHAHAQVVDVRVDDFQGGVLIRLVDDGTGFDVDSAMSRETPGHLGLLAMRERAELAGGWLRVSSGPTGTTVEYWVPDTQVR
jgi:signal transduction histidine kinase